MTYSIIGILAAIILLIINKDVLWWHNDEPISRTRSAYRRFLLAVLCYYVTDALWGILDAYRLTALQCVDTTVYFVAMVVSVLLWTRYVVAYLEKESLFGNLLTRVGQVFCGLALVVIAANVVWPVVFWFDETGAYHAGGARYALLAIQILLFLLSSVYTLRVTLRTEGKERRRHRTIGLFGLAMMLLIMLQVAYPLWPFYAMGYMLGTCLLHSFVVEDEKEENRIELERALERERLQMQELSESREALKDALAAAEGASKAKTAFLSSMSHEIRTPMNAIIGLDTIALADPDISDTTRGYLEKIDSSAHHLLGIINDILDMSRIESGRMIIKSEDFSFAKMLAQVNTIVSGQCNDKGLTYECRTDTNVHNYYVGDDIKLRQVLINILGNAVKFTSEGGAVTLVVEVPVRYDGRSTLRFTISDTGIGMSEDYLPHLFDAFSQEDASTTSRYGSTGLGMPITKSIVELMNGTIEVSSKKGEGTTFVVNVTLLDSDRADSVDDGQVGQPQDLCVLVIDDDEIACEHARVVLGRVGVSCDTAQSGVEGVEMAKLRHARRDAYDLILVDWRMPEMDGVETTRQIRQAVGEETPIIILTSYSWEDVADEAREAGVDTFVSKPLFAGSVLDEFRTAFERKNAQLVKRTADLTGKRVLLAEDMDVNAEIIAMVLALREMLVDRAENGRIAVDVFEESAPGYYDAILMDMRMPEMDGLEATRTIRALERPDATEIPIIALTANAFDEDVQRSMQTGLNAHLSKPVEPEVLFTTLEDLVR